MMKHGKVIYKESILEFNYDISGPNHTFDKDYVPLCDGYEFGGLEPLLGNGGKLRNDRRKQNGLDTIS